MANPDDEPIWAVDRVVAPTLGLAITIPAIANEFAIKGTEYSLKDKNKAKPDKTEHGMEKRGKAKVKSKPKSQTVKVKVNSAKSTVKTGADTEEYLMGKPKPI
ncbi:hypothetical protein Tco_1089591 [Tanacetum coccineum]